MKRTVLMILALTLAASTQLSRAQSTPGNSKKTDKTAIETKIKALLKEYGSSSDVYLVNVKLGWLYLNLGKTANSEYHYKRALRKSEGSLEARLGLYRVYVAAGKYKEAYSYAYDVVKKDNLNYYGNLYLAYCYLGQENYRSAIRTVEKMLRAYPSDQTYLNLLKTLYSKQGNEYRAGKAQKLLDLARK